MWQRFNEQSLLVYQELPNGLITQFTYDAQGNMSRQWDNAGRDKTYQYDQNGKLVQFIFNQDREVIAEQDSLEITRYIRSSELIARNTTSLMKMALYLTIMIMTLGATLRPRRKPSPTVSNSLASSLTQSRSSITCVHGSTIRSSPGSPRRTPTAAMG